MGLFWGFSSPELPVNSFISDRRIVKWLIGDVFVCIFGLGLWTLLYSESRREWITCGGGADGDYGYVVITNVFVFLLIRREWQ